mmetsp:Transcript_12950/g.28606  ORF Transcript_12950/g.28606 Transcript_12950/m.28606 type:complete len:183 (-) Transcript_12950:68-616(-)
MTKSLMLISNFDRGIICACAGYNAAVAWREPNESRRMVLLGLQYGAIRSFVRAKSLGGRMSASQQSINFHAGSHALITAHNFLVVRELGRNFHMGDTNYLVRFMALGSTLQNLFVRTPGGKSISIVSSKDEGTRDTFNRCGFDNHGSSCAPPKQEARNVQKKGIFIILGLKVAQVTKRAFSV